MWATDRSSVRRLLFKTRRCFNPWRNRRRSWLGGAIRPFEFHLGTGTAERKRTDKAYRLGKYFRLHFVSRNRGMDWTPSARGGTTGIAQARVTHLVMALYTCTRIFALEPFRRAPNAGPVGSLRNWAYGLCWLRRISGFERSLIPQNEQQIAALDPAVQLVR